jgi:predicted ABC-type ATPase
MKELIMLGGPNGAGKTTAADLIIANRQTKPTFINADEIAREDAFSTDISAGREMLRRIDDLLDRGKSIALESTCASKGHVRLINKAIKAGYFFSLYFLWLPSSQYAIERVAQRVRNGGHNIPEATIIRRYRSGLRNAVRLYLPLADVAAFYDNSLDSPALLLQKRDRYKIIVENWSWLTATLDETK